jgi:oligoribonuclease NrnB/cAMP/cGMP phosphodiesterase (DHH superfamily)
MAEKKAENKDNVVLYHSPCHDGFTAAWIASRFLGYDNTTIIPMRYNVDYSQEAKFLDGLRERAVYIVDFSLEPKKGLMSVLASASSVVMLDHHKSAMEKLEAVDAFCANRIRYDEFIASCQSEYSMNIDETLEFEMLLDKLDIRLDNDMSGAGLAWDYFYKTRPPKLVEHVEDRDLWKFRDENTRAFMMNLMSYPMKLDVYDELFRKTSSLPGYCDFLAEGRAQLRLFNQYIDQLSSMPLKLLRLPGFEQFKGVVFNANAMFTSELGNRLAEKFDFALIWGFDNKNNDIVVGLRSRADGDCDVSEIAKCHFNGGGHYAASGGRTTLEKFETILKESENVRLKD